MWCGVVDIVFVCVWSGIAMVRSVVAVAWSMVCFGEECGCNDLGSGCYGVQWLLWCEVVAILRRVVIMACMVVLRCRVVGKVWSVFAMVPSVVAMMQSG